MCTTACSVADPKLLFGSDSGSGSGSGKKFPRHQCRGVVGGEGTKSIPYYYLLTKLQKSMLDLLCGGLEASVV
jgi:hypothetical protein